MLLELSDCTAQRGGEVILSHFDFYIRNTEKIAVVGRNGAGKTTLLDVLAGKADPILSENNPGGSYMRFARKVSVGMLSQHAAEDPQKTVAQLIPESASGDAALSFEKLFTSLGFSLEDRTKKIGEFSGGEQTKIMLAVLFVQEPDILLLDEPTNHLDLKASEWLEKRIRKYPGAVVMVSHDRYFIDQCADVVCEVTGKKVIRYAGNYTAFRQEKARRYEKQLRAYQAQQEEIARLDALQEKFRGRPRKASFARSREKIKERMDLIEKPEDDGAVIHVKDIVPERKGPRQVFECDRMSFGYVQAIREISVRIRRGQKIGIFGPNGAGKTAFLRTVRGELPPLCGKLSIGEGLDIAYFDQMTSAIESDQNVITWFHDRFPSLSMQEVRQTLSGYLFHSEDMGKRVSSLSGGEKARLVLAGLLQDKPNVLLMDEPTNNMDIPAMESLESILRAYQGTLLFISHDRYFLSHVAEALLLFPEGTGPILYYPFGYEHYREQEEKKAQGLDNAALRTAQEQRLIEGLRQVPRGSKIQSRQLSTEEETLEWRFDLNRPEREAAQEAYEKAWNELNAVPGTEEEYRKLEEMRSALESKEKEAGEKWTSALLDWYDIWLDTRAGRGKC